MKIFNVPFGKGQIQFDLPERFRATVAEAGESSPIKDLKSALKKSLESPVGSPPLKSLAGKGDRVCIVFTDSTRACPDKVLVSGLLEELEDAGVRDGDITLLCAVGMHRPSTREEKIEKLGKDVCERYTVIDHEADNPDGLVQLGETKEGIPVSVNRIACEADLLMATGIVEPHQYAGYSGGGKTLAVGAGGEPFIARTHGPGMVDHPGTRLGVILGNPFQEAVLESARRAKLRFIANVVLDSEKRPAALLTGNPEACFSSLVDIARDLYEVPVPAQYDVAIAGVGHPKDVNLYQASRAVSYLFFAPTPVVRDGGVFILPAPTPEGAGEGIGEQRFLDSMRRARDMSSLLEELRAKGYPPGAQRAFVMAKVMEKTKVIVAGSRTPEIVKELHMIPAKDMDEAFALAGKIIQKPDPDVLIVPHALLTLPVVTQAF